MSDYGSDSSDSSEFLVRRDYRVRPGFSDIFNSGRYDTTLLLVQRNVQIYRVPDASDNLFFYRTNLQRIPSQIRLRGDIVSVCMRITALASDNTFVRVRAKCLCVYCNDDVTWAHPEPVSCDECLETCFNRACTGYRRCRFHLCTCGRHGRYNLRSGRIV
jgi:hypothetical protein